MNTRDIAAYFESCGYAIDWKDYEIDSAAHGCKRRFRTARFAALGASDALEVINRRPVDYGDGHAQIDINQDGISICLYVVEEG